MKLILEGDNYISFCVFMIIWFPNINLMHRRVWMDLVIYLNVIFMMNIYPGVSKLRYESYYMLPA